MRHAHRSDRESTARHTTTASLSLTFSIHRRSVMRIGSRWVPSGRTAKPESSYSNVATKVVGEKALARSRAPQSSEGTTRKPTPKEDSGVLVWTAHAVRVGMAVLFPAKTIWSDMLRAFMASREASMSSKKLIWTCEVLQVVLCEVAGCSFFLIRCFNSSIQRDDR